MERKEETTFDVTSYAEAKENLRVKQQIEKAETLRIMEKMAITVGNNNSNNLNSNKEEDELDEDEDEFMRQYREKRLAEIQKSQRYVE
jgi:hypothetical protein